MASVCRQHATSDGSARPGRGADDLAEVGTHEIRILECQHVVVDRAEGTIRPVLHPGIESVDDVVFKMQAAGIGRMGSDQGGLVLPFSRTAAMSSTGRRSALSPPGKLVSSKSAGLEGRNRPALLSAVRPPVT